MIAKEKKQAIIAEFGRSEGDTGSPEVQVAILTASGYWDNYRFDDSNYWFTCGWWDD